MFARFRRLTGLFLATAIILAMPCLARADMGRIYTVDAKVSEEAQKAIILHNLDEEILILGTDLKADKNVGIIRFIPFPSEPQVSLAPEGAFDSANELIRKHGLKMQVFTKGEPAIAYPVSLRFHQKLGAHDLTVIKVNDVAHFKEWANNFFKNKNLPQKDSYPEVEGVVEDYVRRGIAYFVFDFVELSDSQRSVEAVMYRFRSKELYYPLLTSNTFGGQGGINLIVICPRSVGNVINFQFKRPFEVEISSSSKIAPQELGGIYPDSGNFFSAQNNLYIQLVNFFGEYYFAKDIIADISKGDDEEIIFSYDSGGELVDGLESVLSDLRTRLPE